MALPSVNLTVQDGGLGLVSQSFGLVALFGIASIPDDNAIVSLSSKDQVLASLGIGPLAKACVAHLSAGGPPLLAVNIATDDAGSTTDVTHVGTGASAASVGGDPADDYEVLIEILAAATDLDPSTATFKYSLDGGDSYSRETAVPISGVYLLLDKDGVSTGLTVTWTDASFVVGDTYSFSTTGPVFALGGVQDAVAAFLSDGRAGSVDFCHLIGVSDATIGAGVATLFEDATAAFIFTWMLITARDINVDDSESEADWMDAVVTDFAEVASVRLAVFAGYAEMIDGLTGEVKRRPGAWAYAPRLAKLPISRNPLAPKDGPLTAVTKLYHDESAAPGLDAARFTTLRKHVNLTGFFVTRGNMMAPTGSDFAEVMNRRVMDAACRAAYARLVLTLGESVQVDPLTGKIKETEALRIEGAVDAAIKAAIGKHVSGAGSQIDRDANLLSTKTLPIKIAIVPFGYIETIEVTIGFQNPLLVS